MFLVNDMRNNKWKTVGYIGILMIICVCSFLVAKYIVRKSIAGSETPIDTSTRIQ